MVTTRFNTTTALCHVFMLVVLWGSAAIARDPSEAESVDKSDSMSEWRERTWHPEIWHLRGRADGKHASPQARKVVERWDNGVVEPEPVLVEAWLEKGKVDEYTGRMEYGWVLGEPMASGTAPAALWLLVVDEDDDLLGIHVREKYVLPNGVESSFVETYPAFLARPEKSSLGASVIPVYLRYGNHVKDEDRWQVYVDEVDRDARSRKTAQPEIWITEPDPNAVTVSISVYDKKGHESDILPVRMVPLDPDAETAWEEQEALKAYKEQGTEVAQWPDNVVKPRPDNAALLYYRAIACQPTEDPCALRIMTLMSHGGQPDDRVRSHLGRCLKTIRLMQLASQIPECDWGLICDPGWEDVTTVVGSLNRLSFLQARYVETLAADGHYRAALENCLVNLRFARHVGDDFAVVFLRSCGAHQVAMRGILDVLAMMPADEQTLRWLRDQLDMVEGAPFHPAATLDKWLNEEITGWRLHEGRRPFERQWAVAQIEDEADRQEATELTDEQLLVRFLCRQRLSRGRQYGLAIPNKLLARAHEQFDEFIASAVRVIDSELPFKDQQARLEELEGEFRHRAKRHEPVALLEGTLTAVGLYHETIVRCTAISACAKAAVEILLVQAETGQLPATIPDGLPKDPFTGRDFEYERAEDGFTLRFDPAHAVRSACREFKLRTLNRRQPEQPPDE